MRECREKGFGANQAQFRQIVQDLVQDIYVRLVDNNCKALKAYEGTSDPAFYKYLSVIARNSVRNYMMREGAQKRPHIDRSLDHSREQYQQTGSIRHANILKAPNTEPLSVDQLMEEIHAIIHKVSSAKDRKRNIIIFQLYFHEGFSPAEIADVQGMKISAKTVSNIITMLKKAIRRELLNGHMEFS